MIRALRSNALLRAAAVIGSGTAIGQLVAVITTPAVTRIYSPAALGAFTLLFTFVNFVQSGSSLMYSAAIPAASTQRDANALVSVSFRLMLPYAILGGLLCYIFITTGVLGFDVLAPYASGLAVAGLLLAGTFTTFRFLLVRQQEYGEVGKALASQNIVRSVSQIAFGLLAPTWWALVLSDVLGRSVGSLPGWRRHRAQRASTPSERRRVVRSFSRYPRVYLPSVIIDNLVVWLPMPLIVAQFGATYGGLFAVVSRVVALPIAVVSTAVADAFHGSLSGAARSGRDPRPEFWTMVKVLASAGVVLAALVATLGGTVIPTVLGNQWRGAGAICIAMAPWFFFQFVVNPVSRVVLVYDGQREKLVYDLFALLLTAVAALLSWQLDWSALGFVSSLALVNSSAYLLYFFILLRILNRSVNKTCVE